MRERCPDQSGKLQRTAVYAGEIFIFRAIGELYTISQLVEERLAASFSEVADLRDIHQFYANTEIQRRLASCRKAIIQSPLIRRLLGELVTGVGLEPQDTLIDVPRLRCVTPGMHMLKEAEAAYSLHRDTWYANPSCQVNWWLPIYDVTEEQMFSIYPRYFSEQISNTSAQFCYSEFKEKVGFQPASGDSTQRAPGHYPTVDSEQELQGAIRWPLKRGELLAFSAAHLHKTEPNNTDSTRFSLDFRTVSIADRDSRVGAPDKDNYSKGDASVDYFPLDHFIQRQ